MSWTARDFIEEGERRGQDIQGTELFGGLSFSGSEVCVFVTTLNLLLDRSKHLLPIPSPLTPISFGVTTVLSAEKPKGILFTIQMPPESGCMILVATDQLNWNSLLHSPNSVAKISFFLEQTSVKRWHAFSMRGSGDVVSSSASIHGFHKFHKYIYSLF